LGVQVLEKNEKMDAGDAAFTGSTKDECNRKNWILSKKQFHLRVVLKSGNLLGFSANEAVFYHADVHGRISMEDLRQSLRKKFLDGIRIFNKYIFNRVILRVAASGRGPFSVVYHTGRKSGRTYRTPVLASYVNDMVIIPLSYGEHVDWLKNVLAAGGCEIVRKDKKISATEPEVINPGVAYDVLPEKRRELFERHKLEKFLCLQMAESKERK
jgi:deazaflavin-dependent oxidoreductase (nitroreductase family)